MAKYNMAKYARMARLTAEGIVMRKPGYLYFVDRMGVVMETPMKRKM